jgi:hypothetical protein
VAGATVVAGAVVDSACVVVSWVVAVVSVVDEVGPVVQLPDASVEAGAVDPPVSVELGHAVVVGGAGSATANWPLSQYENSG